LITQPYVISFPCDICDKMRSVCVADAFRLRFAEWQSYGHSESILYNCSNVKNAAEQYKANQMSGIGLETKLLKRRE
jgi:hypothetical protein